MEINKQKYIDKELRSLENTLSRGSYAESLYQHLLNDPMSFVSAKLVKNRGKACYYVRPLDCPLEDLPCFMDKEDFENTYQLL
jgi:hypothetical protein